MPAPQHNSWMFFKGDAEFEDEDVFAKWDTPLRKKE